jgi:hypothetical protein
LFFRHLLDGCDHLVVVAGVERVSIPAQSLNEPLNIFRRRVVVEYCDLCDTVPASLAVYGSRLAPPPANPALMCRTCFDVLHAQSADLAADDGDFCVVALPQIR